MTFTYNTSVSHNLFVDECLKYFDWINGEDIQDSSIEIWIPAGDNAPVTCACECLDTSDFQCVAFKTKHINGNWSCGLASTGYAVENSNSSEHFRIEKMPCK